MTFPEPPWTQAPSEVMAWGSSIRGRTPSTAASRRPTRVKGYEIHLPAAEEPRILARFSRLGLGSRKQSGLRLPRVVSRLAHHATPEAFLGRIGGIRVEVRLRTRTRLEVRVTFLPHPTLRKAWRIVDRLGLRPAEGRWR